MMKSVLVIVGVCLGTLWNSAHAQETAAPKWKKSIQLSPLTSEELVAIPLDHEVYTATRDSLAGLTILDSKNQKVPYVLQQRTQTTTQEEHRLYRNASNVELKPSTKELEIHLELPGDIPAAEGIRLQTPLHDFQHNVRVFAMDGEATDKPLVDGVLIYDYSRFLDVQNLEIPLPKNSHRKFRLLISDPTADQEAQFVGLTKHLQGGNVVSETISSNIEKRPFRIDLIEFYHLETLSTGTTPELQTSPVHGTVVAQDEKTRQTVIETRADYQPLSRVTFLTTSRNFSRTVTVFSSTEKNEQITWNQIASGKISRVDFRDLHQEVLAIDFPETRCLRFRLTIENGDNTALENIEVECAGPTQEVVFLAQPKESYQLLYGKSEANPGKYDTAAIQLLLEKKIVPAPGTLGKQEIAPALPVPAKEFSYKDVLTNPVVLIVGIGILIAVLGWSLIRAAKQLPPAEGQNS